MSRVSLSVFSKYAGYDSFHSWRWASLMGASHWFGPHVRYRIERYLDATEFS